jgi:hypothetical protein
MFNYYTLMYFPFWVLCIFLHYILSLKTYDLGLSIRLQTYAPLYDIVQRNFPNLQRYRIIPEFLHVIPVILLLLYIITGSSDVSTKAFNKFLVTHGPLMALRGIFFSVTLLPDSSEMCLESGHIGSCFDLIFSGHSTIMLLCTMLIREFFNVSTLLYSTLMIKNFITCFMIIVCRNHYTIDVLISICMTYFVYMFSEFKL